METRIKRTNQELIWFILIALMSCVSDFSVFTGLVFIGTNLFASQAVSRIVGGVTSFLLNKYLNFKTPYKRALVEARRFLFLYGVSYFLSLALLGIFHKILGLPLFYSKIMADGTCFVFNFIVMKLYVYTNIRGLIEGSLNLAKRGLN